TMSAGGRRGQFANTPAPTVPSARRRESAFTRRRPPAKIQGTLATGSPVRVGRRQPGDAPRLPWTAPTGWKGAPAGARLNRTRKAMTNERVPMTREGYEKLKADLDRMQNVQMIEVAKRI